MVRAGTAHPFPGASFWIDPSGRARIGAPPDTGRILCGVSDWRSRLLNAGTVVPPPGGERHPLTALGLDRDARFLLFVVVDGRREEYSVGMTLEELANEMKSRGCQDAINMDGGGSSSMLAIRDGDLVTVNRPVSDRPRPLPVMIGVRQKRGRDGAQ